MKIGPILKMYRTRAGLDARTLAIKAGISQSHLSRMENDHSPTSLHHLGAICNVLGTSPWKILKIAEEYAAKVQPELDLLEEKILDGD